MEAQTFYRKFAKRIENPLAKQRIQDLAKEEGRHKQMLLSRYRAVTNEVKPPISKSVDRKSLKALEENTSKEDLLKIAIAKE
jgi:rubrerythrin